MSTLYDIRADLEALEALLYEVGGDVTDEAADAAITAWLEETGEALSKKLDGYAALIRETEIRAASRKAEASRLSDLARADDAAVKRLKDRLRWFFEDRGIQKMETERFRFTLATNGGKPPVILKVPVECLPEWAKRVTFAPDLEAIRGEIEKGGTVEFAEIGTPGTHLRIR